jgi:DNA-binding NarL/FixJ family response regulator
MVHRVLIADDNPTVRLALRLFIQGRNDLELCAEASDGREAVDMALACKPDFLIIDMVMPELNGIEVCRRLKNALPRAKKILFTIYGESIGKHLAAAVGVNVVLAKMEGLTKLANVLDCFVHASDDLSPASGTS